MKFIHLSDFHLRDPESSHEAAARAEMVAGGMERLAREYPDSDFWVITGDIADDGADGVYRWLKHKADTAPCPVVPLMGNHDNRDCYHRHFGGTGFVQSVLDTGGVRCVFLDTLQPGRDGGRLCEVRLSWLQHAVAGRADRPLLLFLHHPPCDIGDPEFDPIRLENPEDLAAALAGGDVRHLFFGHIHRTLFTTWNGIPCASLAQPRRAPTAMVCRMEGDRLTCVSAGRGA